MEQVGSNIWMQWHHVCGTENAVAFGPERWNWMLSNGNQPTWLGGGHQLLDNTQVSQLIWPRAFPGMTN
jgi:hypothetical protein